MWGAFEDGGIRGADERTGGNNGLGGVFVLRVLVGVVVVGVVFERDGCSSIRRDIMEGGFWGVRGRG